MKAKYLLLFAASLLLIGPSPSLSAPVQVAIESSQLANNGNQVYQQVNPAVVTVFAGREIGSGSIVSTDGLVITNNHVIRGSQNGYVFVRTTAGTRYPGRVIATDVRKDLALIQLDTQETLPAVRLASRSVQPGDSVYAIGSPYGRPGVMTTGSFSRVRENGDLQSQVILRPGNSGGPLLNNQGEMVGVNKAILDSRRGNTGISFATSIEATKAFIEANRPGRVAVAPPSYTPRSNPVPTPLPNLPVHQPIEQASDRSIRRQPTNDVVIQEPTYSSGLPSSVPSNGRLGVIMDTRTLVIREVENGSIAANSGLQAGDQLLEINGNPLSGFQDVLQFMSSPPRYAQFTISRQGQPTTVAIRF
ncbi:trypsin-like peptidase domain-containing protein [Pantanalinema sp. GBBB05]|uniref:S1C family serine protease n=1 Tax=Pantanalinema sp. GBBB05 TaxID=2604139 RepID=UPI001D683ABF|nr:trypsin-like serine protease [Pantanalinema sp. GBBB05]